MQECRLTGISRVLIIKSKVEWLCSQFHGHHEVLELLHFSFMEQAVFFPEEQSDLIFRDAAQHSTCNRKNHVHNSRSVPRSGPMLNICPQHLWLWWQHWWPWNCELGMLTPHMAKQPNLFCASPDSLLRLATPWVYCPRVNNFVTSLTVWIMHDIYTRDRVHSMTNASKNQCMW